MTCVFCDIVNGTSPARVLRMWAGAMAIMPLNPVVPGHLLVIPKVHVPDALVDSEVTAMVMRYAAEVARGQQYEGCNIITSCGEVATQTIFHLHIHIVPRRAGDGLALPWTNQECGPDCA